MKKALKFSLSLIITISLLFSVFVFNASAATVTVSGGTYNVNDEVRISVKYIGDTVLQGVQVKEFTYNPDVLKFKNIVGIDDLENGFNHNAASGIISFTDMNFSSTSKQGSYTLIFTAIAEGTSNISVKATDDTKSDNEVFVGNSTVTVTRSSNANLAYIKLSDGTLSPSFNAATTIYEATVKYDVDAITISASPADGSATFHGAGTFALNVGENENFITVTAENGTKKVYEVHVKRMTEEETAAYEQEQRDSNPLLAIINGKDYTISNDLTNVPIPAGFTQGTAVRKESEITVLNDNAGKYQLCWLIDNNGKGAFYSRDAEDNFKKLVYINAGGKMYIVENFDIEGILPMDYKFSTCTIDGVEVRSVNYADTKFKDFNIFNCYVDGKTAHYRLDSVEGTMQRAVDFDAALEAQEVVEIPTVNEQIAETPQNNGKKISKTGLMVIGLVALIAVILIALTIMIIVKIASPKEIEEYGYGDATTNASEFIFGDAQDETEGIPLDAVATESLPTEEALDQQPEISEEENPPAEESQPEETTAETESETSESEENKD